MVDAHGGPTPSPRPRPSTRASPKEDVEMVDSSESESGSSSDSDMDSPESSSSSDTDTTEPNTPNRGQPTPSPPLRTPKPWRTKDLQPEDWQEGTVASTDRSVIDSLVSIASRRKAPSDLEDVEAARRRVEAQRRDEAKRIRVEQLQKQARLGAWKLRQHADDLEREAAEHAARLLGEMEEATASTAAAMDEDGLEVRSNHSYTPTETSSSDDDEYWSSSPSLPFYTPTLQAGEIDERSPTPTLPATPSPSIRRQAQQPRPLSRQHAVAIPLASSPTSSPPGAETQSFVVVAREVIDGLNELTGSPVRRTKQYRVRAADLESLHEDSDMEEV
ncbi:hypothetical protein BJV78DRAFT_1175720 [Lactifluus subvellereus]|nr:hypothetical protein BJV78DRAFT_1175720 [Lactifluus subvellereus]